MTYPANEALAATVARVPADRLLVETDAPWLSPQPVAARNQPAYVVHTARFVAERRGIAYEELDAAVEATAAALLAMVTQPSLRRLAEFGVRPKRDLGQNFLIDSNILGVIDRAAELGPEDVVLEIGGGLGVLSEHLAPLSRHVHVVEIDRALEAPLREALEAHPNTTLHIADALDLDLTALDPLPTKVVANLPYGIAATAILRTVEDLPGVERWVAMVQKEVGQRFAAKEGVGGIIQV